MVSKWWPLLAALALGVGCGQDVVPLTQLILVADTDIPSVDTVQFEISSQDHSQNRTASAARTPNGAPSYVSLVHDEGSLGPITVSARGLHAGVFMVERTERVYFVQDETRVVPLHLLASCVGVVCPESQTCAAGGCMSKDVAGSELPTWRGEPPHLGGGTSADAGVDAGADAGLDAGIMDGGNNHRPDASNMMMDAMASRDGAAMDATVDARASDAATDFVQCNDTGPLVDLTSDLLNCGMCGLKCSGARICSAGACVKK